MAQQPSALDFARKCVAFVAADAAHTADPTPETQAALAAATRAFKAAGGRIWVGPMRSGGEQK